MRDAHEAQFQQNFISGVPLSKSSSIDTDSTEHSLTTHPETPLLYPNKLHFPPTPQDLLLALSPKIFHSTDHCRSCFWEKEKSPRKATLIYLSAKHFRGECRNPSSRYEKDVALSYEDWPKIFSPQKLLASLCPSPPSNLSSLYTSSCQSTVPPQ